MISRIVINLCGRKRTGKESAFKVMLPYVDRPEEFQFATPLKKFCMEVLGLTRDQCYGTSEDRERPTKYKWSWVNDKIRTKYGKAADQTMTSRDVLQVVGTDLMRQQFYKNIWAEAGIREAVNSTANTCIFTDGRFPNELDAGGDAWLVDKTFMPNSIVVRLYRDTGLNDAHDSETALDVYDIEPNQRKILLKHCERLRNLGYIEITPSLWESNNCELPFDYLLDNNSTLDNLKNNILYILKKRDILVEPSLS